MAVSDGTARRALLDLAGRERHVQVNVDAFVAMLAREWVVDLAGYKNLYENAPTKHAASRRWRAGAIAYCTLPFRLTPPLEETPSAGGLGPPP